MKNLFVQLFLVLALLIPATSFAKGGKAVRQAGNIGVGLGAGTFAAGLSLKYFTDQSLAIQGNIGEWRSRWWGRCNDRYCYDGGGDGIALSVDVLFEQDVFAGNGNVDLGWNAGVGGGLGVSDYRDETAAAIAGILGLELLINVIPIDIVLEFRPSVMIVPDIHFDLIDFTGHIRFYF